MAQVWSEEHKYDGWLQVEIAACEAWGEQGVVPPEAVEKIRAARYDREDIARYEEEEHHDFNSFLRSVADSLGEESRFVHLGLTSYDAEDTALGLRLVEAAALLERDIEELLPVLEQRAVEFKDTLCMGRSHGVHAEPTTFGLKLAGWVDEMRRNARRLAEAKADVAVGKISGPVGTHASVPPAVEEAVCARLGLGVDPVSTQIVSRDRHARFVVTLAVIGASLERFATELRHLQRTEVMETEEPFSEGQKGSSSMPHKRNPEKLERICGLARLLRGYTVPALENVALWHERDISHSSAERVILPDACLALDYMLDLFTKVMRGLQVYPERMRENMDDSYGLPFSQRVLLALIGKGRSRQEAYAIVQRNAMQSWKERRAFRELLDADSEVRDQLSAAELDELFDYSYYTRYVDESFRRLGLT
ncbi:MAG: adenylosuccinate lyase [Chloroflexi bacterium]|nr:adenylosuccinate lyase [Chloroflexota bacterium]